MEPRSRRISPLVTDVSSANQLLSYATAGQLALVQKYLPDISLSRIAYGARFGTSPRTAAPALTTAVRDGPSVRQLERFDEIVGALVPDAIEVGRLSSLALRLFPDDRSFDKSFGSLIANVPPSWTGDMFKYPPVSEVQVLLQASVLLTAFMAAERTDPVGRSIVAISERYSSEIDHLVRRLILITAAPPTAKTYDAPVLLGGLASYIFEQIRGRLDRELRYSPLGFQVWPAITTLVKLDMHKEHATALKSWVRELILDSEDLRLRSLYSGRGLDLELAMAIPSHWSPPEDDWVGRALLSRAGNNHATIRERGTAAMGLWERAMTQGTSDRMKVEKDLRQLIVAFRDPATRPDAAAGLRWVAATIEHVIDNRVAVCNDWPVIEEPWFQHVRGAMQELDHASIPDHLLPGTKSLFQHMILQNSDVYCQRAIETVVTGGWAEPVTRSLGLLLDREKTEGWLRTRVEFALGRLQQRNRKVEEYLTRACLDVHRILQQEGEESVPPLRSHITELQTALFAVGDCFGVAGAEESADRARKRLRPVLVWLANMEGPRARGLRRAARAAAYLLTVSAQPTIGEEEDLAYVLLKKLSEYPDEVTADLSRWALSIRFSPDGGVLPLLEAP